MSQLWPELLRIVFCPDHVILEHGKLTISLKGLEPRYSEPEVIPVEPGHEPSLWAAPLTVLGIALDGLSAGKYDVSVILSNHFVHYPFARADLNRTSADPIEATLISALNDTLIRHHCRLTSLRPRIMEMSSDLHDETQEEPVWLVVVEDGLACFGLIKDGEISHLRNLCMWPASSVELLALLDQEAKNIGFEELPRNIVLWRQHESDEVFLPANSDWQITRIGELSAYHVPSHLVSRPILSNAIRT